MEKTVWKLTLAYDGTDFHGWQVQRDAAAQETAPDTASAGLLTATIQGTPTATIQGTLSRAIAAVTGEHVLPQGSGRTDAGVHAAAQVASFPLTANIPAGNLQRALNRVLPPSIRILAVEPAAPDFHARHSARGKIYRYRIFEGGVCSPFFARYVACSRWRLDLGAMQRAAEMILGEHDFSSFAAHDPDRATRLREPANPLRSNIRRIDASCWSSAPADSLALDGNADDNEARILTYVIQGNGFLHHMVRNLVGTFLDAGRGRIAPGVVAEILAGRDRALAGPTAPASGLCLMEVLY